MASHSLRALRSAALLAIVAQLCGCNSSEEKQNPASQSVASTPEQAAAAKQEEKVAKDPIRAMEDEIAQLKAKADAAKPDLLSVASYANFIADQDKHAETESYIKRIEAIHPGSKVAAELKRYLNERKKATDKKARRAVRSAHMKRYFKALEEDLKPPPAAKPKTAVAPKNPKAAKSK